MEWPTDVFLSPAGCVCAHHSVLHTWMSSICGPRCDLAVWSIFPSLLHYFCALPSWIRYHTMVGLYSSSPLIVELGFVYVCKCSEIACM